MAVIRLLLVPPGGYYTEGRMIDPLARGAASLVIYANGSVTVGAWGSDVTMTPSVVMKSRAQAGSKNVSGPRQVPVSRVPLGGYLVNPVLQFPDEEEQDGEEGCLSFPGIYYDVKRRLNTVARGLTDRGDHAQVVGTEVLARCLQHQTDHLDGVLFVDRMDAATRKLAVREIRGSEDMQRKMSWNRKTGRIL